MSHDARLSTALPGHPKTKKLIRRVGEAGAWHLVCLILWARDNRPDGDLTGMTIEDIELAVDWRGDADAFVAALSAVGFLDGEEGAYQLHDWSEHQPWASGSEARSEKARWAAMVRRHGRPEAARQMPEYAARLATGSDSAATGRDEPATSSDVEVPDSASGTNSAAPSPNPSPSPSPSPSPKAEAIPPIPPADAGEQLGSKKGKGTRTPSESITFAAFVQACREAGQKPVPADDPIFKFADDANIPREFLRLAWRAFGHKHRAGKKRQKGLVGWRAHFRDAVRGNWAKVWYFPAEGQPASLTTVGIGLKREMDAEAAEAEAAKAAAEQAA